jgi:tRNA(fMet)-specific endonuclease VapC
MKYLLDTNACVHNLRKKGSALVKARLGSHPPADIVLCSIVVGELRYGAEGATDPLKEHAKVDAFVAQFVSLSFDDDAASIYGRIRHDLESRGLPIGANDLLVAAIALAHDLTLVTHNTSEFSRITGLKLEDWEIP